MYKSYKNCKIHLVLYSNNEPYKTTKLKTIQSIKHLENVKIHSFSLENIQNKEWFKQYIKPLRNYKGNGSRDGYWNCWKSFIVRDVLQQASYGDVVYYVDSSKYHIEGFKYDINPICELVKKYGFIAGSCGDDIMNGTSHCCHNLSVWNTIHPFLSVESMLKKKHILNSWFLMVKSDTSTSFVNEWCYWSTYMLNNRPLVTYHHTADQSIFNILCYKHHSYVFYDKNIRHNENKDKHLVLKTLNTNKILRVWDI